jgi:hypothetical protein
MNAVTVVPAQRLDITTGVDAGTSRSGQPAGLPVAWWSSARAPCEETSLSPPSWRKTALGKSTEMSDLHLGTFLPAPLSNQAVLGLLLLTTRSV